MNIVQFWEQQVAKWNTEQKCGMCWNFVGAMTESARNAFIPEEGKECCVQVILVRDRMQAFNSSLSYSDLTGLLNGVQCNKNFKVYFLVKSDIGTNNYNEQPGHLKSESKWNSILWQIESCIECDAQLDFCEILGYKPRIRNWSGEQLINDSDANYTGYRLTVGYQTIK